MFKRIFEFSSGAVVVVYVGDSQDLISGDPNALMNVAANILAPSAPVQTRGLIISFILLCSITLLSSFLDL